MMHMFPCETIFGFVVKNNQGFMMIETYVHILNNFKGQTSQLKQKVMKTFMLVAHLFIICATVFHRCFKDSCSELT